MAIEPLFASIASHSPDSVMLLDREASIRFINRTAPGLTVEDVVGTAVFDYVPEAQHEAMRRCFAEVVETGEPGRYDNIYTTPDGHTSHWESRVGPTLEDGEVTGFVVFSSDVTDRREAALERDRIFELSLDLLAIIGFDGHFKRVNPAFSNTLGFSEDELLRSPFLELIHPDDRSKSEACFRGLVERNRPVTSFENRFATKAGDHRVLQWTATVDPASRRVIAVARDVTDRRALEGQLVQAQKMYAVGQLAGGVAHDFNNLLMTILANAQFGQRGPGLDDTTRGHLEEIEGAAERAADLTRQLLGFSRREPLRRARVDLNELTSALMKLLRRVIPEDIAIEFEPGGKLDAISADGSQLEQILMNLCVNARDAMPDGGRITIGTRNAFLDGEYTDSHPWASPGNHVLLSVRDSGGGIPDPIRARVFEPFFTTKPAGEGTGLGLSTVYGIVQQHDGMVHVHSEIGQGTTFEIYLPSVERGGERATKERGREPPGGSETLLLAEDDPLVRRVVVSMLERAGYHVVVASNGREAYERARRSDVALAILDIVMPEMSGPDAATRIREIRPELPILFTSGYAPGGRAADKIPPGTVTLSKPYKNRALLQEVRAHLDARKH